MTAHPQFEEDLALYALGTLDPESRLALEEHLEECASCRRELEQLRGDMALLALSPAGYNAPDGARERLLNAIAREPRRAAFSKRYGWWALIPYLAAAALALVAIVVWRQNSSLRHQLTALQASWAQQRLELERARHTLATFTSPEALRVTLVAVKTPPQPQGKAFYLSSEGRLIFRANNLPQLL